MAFTMHRPAGGPELSVVVPTFNERDNIELLLARLEAALRGIEWEGIYVDDDSPMVPLTRSAVLRKPIRASAVSSGSAAAACLLRSSKECLRAARHTWRSSMPTSSMTRRRSRECSAPSKNKASI